MSTSEATKTCSSVSGYPTPNRNHIFGSVAAYTGASFWIGNGGPTNCSMQTTSTFTSSLFTFGAEIPPSMFAPGSIITE